jgi:hypothetical protein
VEALPELPPTPELVLPLTPAAPTGAAMLAPELPGTTGLPPATPGVSFIKTPSQATSPTEDKSVAAPTQKVRWFMTAEPRYHLFAAIQDSNHANAPVIRGCHKSFDSLGMGPVPEMRG